MQIRGIAIGNHCRSVKWCISGGGGSLSQLSHVYNKTTLHHTTQQVGPNRLPADNSVYGILYVYDYA